ncbi:MAG: sigma-54 dependent transcriptional regulator [Proteobacteria bacterium]|nr:sigma-54 dependent transcriptional regulator [Pseudomonadota bacterium]
MDTILIVDDEINYLSLLRTILEEEGFNILTAESGQTALAILEDSDIDLIITDMKMPEMNGLFLLDKVRSGWPDIPVIMMTAHGSVEKAVETMQKGAFTYIQKPFDNNRLLIFVNKALNHSRVVQENKRLRNVVKSQFSFGNIVGKSKSMHKVLNLVNKVAPTSAHVLVEGESGTGKELIARSIHFNSPRRHNPFIAVNCSALSESLLESELFGHEKGAFTGAITMKKGRFELAHTGTLFLDEIGELSQNLQVKILRVIQEKSFERVGGTSVVKVNFRLITATNKILKDEVKLGRFREDLYYRLNVVYIHLPPLRERPEDIHLLAHHFFNTFSEENISGRTLKGIAPECERILLESKWPGNVRQLENTIERAMILCTGEYISPCDLPKDIFESSSQNFPAPEMSLESGLYATLSGVEKQMIIHALEKANGIQTHAAKLLKIGKSGLNQKMKKYGIRVGDILQ